MTTSRSTRSAGHPSIPEVYALGQTQYYEYMALEELGGDIYEPLERPEGLTSRNLVALTCQMVCKWLALTFCPDIDWFAPQR